MTTVTTHPNINIREKLNELDYRYVPYDKMPPGSIIQNASVSLQILRYKLQYNLEGLI